MPDRHGMRARRHLGEFKARSAVGLPVTNNRPFILQSYSHASLRQGGSPATHLCHASFIVMFLIVEYWLKLFVSMFPLHGILIAPSMKILSGVGTREEGESMGEPARVASIEREQRHALPEYSWDELSEAGTYVEKETGDLYRIPRELLIQGPPPLICRASLQISRLVQVSKNPFMTTFVARIICAQHNVKANF